LCLDMIDVIRLHWKSIKAKLLISFSEKENRCVKMQCVVEKPELLIIDDKMFESAQNIIKRMSMF
jgi:hypothetical protein